MKRDGKDGAGGMDEAPDVKRMYATYREYVMCFMWRCRCVF